METKEKTVAVWFVKVDGRDTPIDGIDYEEVLKTVPREDQSFFSRLHSAFKLGDEIIHWLFVQLGALRSNNTVLSCLMSQRVDEVLRILWRIYSWSPRLFELGLAVKTAQVEAFVFHVQERRRKSESGCSVAFDHTVFDKWGQSLTEGILDGHPRIGKVFEDSGRNIAVRTRVIEPLLRISRGYSPPGFRRYTVQQLIAYAGTGFGGVEWTKANVEPTFREHA